jgi:hypothetical protein
VHLEAEACDVAEGGDGQRVEHAPKVGIGTPLTPSALAERLPGNDDSKACVGCQRLDIALSPGLATDGTAIYLRPRICSGFGSATCSAADLRCV